MDVMLKQFHLLRDHVELFKVIECFNWIRIEIPPRANSWVFADENSCSICRLGSAELGDIETLSTTGSKGISI